MIVIMSNKLKSNIIEKFESLYQKKDFDGALDYINTNKESFDLAIYHYNLGAIYFSKDDFVKARVYFEKSKMLGFESNEVNTAIRNVKKSLDIVHLESSETILESIQFSLIGLSFDAYVTLALILGLLSLTKKINTILRYVFFILTPLPVIFYFFYVSGHTYKLSIEDKVIYKGPSRMFDQVQEIPKGMLFITKDRLEGWQRVILPKSHQGWIIDENMESI